LFIKEKDPSPELPLFQFYLKNDTIHGIGTAHEFYKLIFFLPFAPLIFPGKSSSVEQRKSKGKQNVPGIRTDLPLFRAFEGESVPLLAPCSTMPFNFAT